MEPTQPPNSLHKRENYWDQLGRPRLTKNALREVQRRAGKQRYGPRTPPREATAILQGFDKRRLRELSRLSRHGGPDLTELRGYPAPQTIEEASAEPTYTSAEEPGRGWDYGLKEQAANTANTTTYSCNFEDHLIGNLIYPPGYKYPHGREPAPPGNLEELNEMIAAPRASVLTYPRDDFENFAITYWSQRTEEQVKKSVASVLEGKLSQHVGRDRRFTNLAQLIDGTELRAKPDIFHGARATEVNTVIRQKLNDQIVPFQNSGLVAPNFFLKVKGANVSAVEAERQACFYGAFGARAIHALHSYEQDQPAFDRNAYSITATYSRGLLELYATHMASSGRDPSVPEYVMTRLGEWAIHGSMESFQEGLTAYRNARDWAKEKRDQAVTAANQRQPAPKPAPSRANSVRKPSQSEAKSNARTNRSNSRNELRSTKSDLRKNGKGNSKYNVQTN